MPLGKIHTTGKGGLHMVSNNRNLQQAAEQIADKTYKPSHYQSGSFTEQGLAMTHEQVSDDYMEGTNDGKIEK
jgi:hypothetical protein